jgi:hypothetical protein
MKNSYSELGGMLTPKFGKLTVEKNKSANGVKNKKIIYASWSELVRLNHLHCRVGKGYLIFQIFGKERHKVYQVKQQSKYH